MKVMILIIILIPILFAWYNSYQSEKGEIYFFKYHTGGDMSKDSYKEKKITNRYLKYLFIILTVFAAALYFAL